MMMQQRPAMGPELRPQPSLAASPQPVNGRRHARRSEARRVATCAPRLDTLAACSAWHQEREGSTTASTCHAPSRHMSAGSRDVRTHVAAPVPSTHSSASHLPLVTSTRISSTGMPHVPTTTQLQPALDADTPSPSGHLQDKALYDEIKSCDSWQDVLEIIADEAPAISLYTATQAASKIVSTLRSSPLGMTKATAMLHMQPAFKALLDILISGVPRMTRAQLCNSLHALAQLKVTLTDAAAAAYSLRTQQLAPELNARDVAQLLHGWGHIKRHPGQQALDLVGFRAKMLLEEGAFEPQSLSMALTGLAALEYRNHLLLGAAASVATLRMEEFTPQGVANVCMSLAKLGHLSLATLASAARAFSQNAEQYKPQEVCNLLWAMTQLRYHPQEALAPMVRHLVQRASSLRPVDYSMLFHALGTFGVHPGNQSLSELVNPLPKQLQRFTAAELSSVFWGLGMIGETRQPVFAQIAVLLPDHFQAGRLNDGLLRQVFQGFLCNKLDEVMNSQEEGRRSQRQSQSVSFPPVMMEAMKKVWKESSAAGTVQKELAAAQAEGEQEAEVAEAQPETSSQTAGPSASKQRRRRTIKEEVAAIVKSLRVQHELARPTKDGLVMIDIAIRASEDRFIALQVVMEHEHTCNTGQFLGSLQFQTQIMEMNGWEVRHVRAKDLKQLDHASKPMFLADLLRGMGVRVARSAAERQAGGARTQGKTASGLDMLVDDDAENSSGRSGSRSRGR